MKLDEKAPVRSNYQGKTIDFSLDLSNAGHITQILRKQIYSQHDLAVIREYITNALDEHAKHGIEVPVQVELPTKHNAFTFKVRDFAKGLPTEDIENLYVKYGASTKRESNSQAGCLGIGCKAAFAYTDTFNITSYHSSGTHSYIATLTNATGQLHHMETNPIPEDPRNHGMLIEVNVPENKATNFIETTIKYLNYVSKDLVNLVIDSQGTGLVKWDESCHRNWKINPDSIFLESDDESAYPWYFTEENPMSSNHCVITMGNVPYPINVTNASGSFKYLINSTLVVDAPLGSLSIAANREEIQYDERSNLTLDQIEQEIDRTIKLRAQETIEKAESWSKAVKTFRDFQLQINPEYKQWAYRQNIWKSLGDYTWRGAPLSLFRKGEDVSYSEHVKKSSYSRAAVTPYSWSHDHHDHLYIKNANKIRFIQNSGDFCQVYLWNPEEISRSKMQQLVSYNHRKMEGDDLMETWIILSPRAEEEREDDKTYPTYEEIKKELGHMGDLLHEVSELAPPPRAVRTSTTSGSTANWRTPAKYVCRILPSEGKQSDRLSPVSMEDDTPLTPTFKDGDKELRLFFPFKKHKLLFPGSDREYPWQTEDIGFGSCPLKRMLKTMKPELEDGGPQFIQHGLVFPYYAIPAKKKLPEGGMWFHDYAKELFDEFSKTKLWKDNKTWEELANRSKRRHVSEHCLFNNLGNKAFKNSEIPLLRKLRTFEQTVADSHHNCVIELSTFDKAFNQHPRLNPKDSLNFDKIREDYDKLLQRFPLLPSMIKHYHYDNETYYKWYDGKGKRELSYTWIAWQKYIKAPIPELEEKEETEELKKAA
tara:strand:+ start:117 stop:2579 length:2463 start_codon:yes stop_codon:yes gene_type:complete